MIAVESAATVPAVTVQLTLVPPAGTVTEDGMVTFAESAPRIKVMLTASTAADASVAVHVVLPAAEIAAGLQESWEMWPGGLMVRVAPLAVAATGVAADEVAVSPVRSSANDVGACSDTAKVAVARTPFGMALVFKPQTMHRTSPVPLAQDKDFPAEVNAAPAVRFMLLMSVAE